MLLIAFAFLALLAAGVFAFNHGDAVVFVGLLVVGSLVIIVVAPQVTELQQHINHLIDAKLNLPVAMR